MLWALLFNKYVLIGIGLFLLIGFLSLQFGGAVKVWWTGIPKAIEGTEKTLKALEDQKRANALLLQKVESAEVTIRNYSAEILKFRAEADRFKKVAETESAKNARLSLLTKDLHTAILKLEQEKRERQKVSSLVEARDVLHTLGIR